MIYINTTDNREYIFDGSDWVPHDNSVDEFYRHSNANIHRGVHTLAEEATHIYEQAREKAASFINSSDSKQIIFTRNATESINLVANTWARENLKKGEAMFQEMGMDYLTEAGECGRRGTRRRRRPTRRHRSSHG
jgi:hypothetical protein